MSYLTDEQYNKVMVGFVLNRSTSFPVSRYRRRFPSIRFDFLRLHSRSMAARWRVIDKPRRNLFRGSPVAYILCLSC